VISIARIVFSFLILVPAAVNSYDCNPFNFSLLTVDGKAQSLKTEPGHLATAFIFLLPDCPACQSYSLSLNELAEKYKGNGIRFMGVVPGKFSTNDEISEFQSSYKINFPVLKDPSNLLVKCLGASIVPEVFLVAHDGKTIYSGRIDDWMAALGKKKPAVTQHDFRDALEAFVNHQPVKVKRTKAIGCFIE
jgi:thiol-disulfide isomerase/thioredoxin